MNVLAHLVDGTLGEFGEDEGDDSLKVTRNEVTRKLGQLSKHNGQNITKLEGKEGGGEEGRGRKGRKGREEGERGGGMGKEGGGGGLDERSLKKILAK